MTIDPAEENGGSWFVSPEWVLKLHLPPLDSTIVLFRRSDASLMLWLRFSVPSAFENSVVYSLTTVINPRSTACSNVSCSGALDSFTSTDACPDAPFPKAMPFAPYRSSLACCMAGAISGMMPEPDVLTMI